jgi:hypothetical protein
MKAVRILLLICAVSVTAYGQRSQGTSPNSAANLPLKERLFFGGGGSFGSGVHPYYGFKYTYISVSPLVGYRITLPWAAGVQVTYQTYRFPTQGVNLDQYGVAPFTQYRFGKLFGYAEYQMISVPSFDKSFRTLYKRLPIGIGFTQPIGQRAAINAVALYDVVYNRATSPFASPWILRVYFTAGGISF